MNLPRAPRNPRLRVLDCTWPFRRVRWAPGTPSPERLRSALDTMLHGGEPRAQVRDDIWTSWRRSASSGLSPEQFTVPHTGDGDRDGLLVRAARPVLSSLTDDLASTNVGLLLTGRDGDILDRWVPERSLGSRFDRVHLAPGFVYTEPAVGTNGIGTAIAAPALVRAAASTSPMR